MDSSAATKPRGRPQHPRDDPTMRYIAKKDLWNAVALQCGISVKAVRQWPRVPTKRVRDVEAAIGRRRSQIRPDLYGRKPKNADNVTA